MIDDLHVAEEVRRFGLQRPQHGNRELPDLYLRRRAPAHLAEVSPRPGVTGNHDLRFRTIVQNGTRRLTRPLLPHGCGAAFTDLRRHLGQEIAVRSQRAFTCPDPDVEGAGPFFDLGRQDKPDVRLVDIALRELGEAEPSAMAHELVRERAADALEQAAPDRVLQHRAVLGVEDVREICLVRRPARVLRCHWCQDHAGPASQLGRHRKHTECRSGQ